MRILRLLKSKTKIIPLISDDRLMKQRKKNPNFFKK